MNRKSLMGLLVAFAANTVLAGDIFTASLESGVASLENGKCKESPMGEDRPVVHFDSPVEVTTHKTGESVSILVHDGTIVTGKLTATNVWEVCKPPEVDVDIDFTSRVEVKLDTDFKWPRNRKLLPYLATVGRVLKKDQVGSKQSQPLPPELRKAIAKILPQHVKLEADTKATFISAPGAEGQYVVFSRDFAREGEEFNERSYLSHTSFWLKEGAGWKLVDQDESSTEVFSVTSLDGGGAFELGLRISEGPFSGYKYKFRRFKKGFVPGESLLLFKSEGC